MLCLLLGTRGFSPHSSWWFLQALICSQEQEKFRHVALRELPRTFPTEEISETSAASFWPEKRDKLFLLQTSVCLPFPLGQ